MALEMEADEADPAARPGQQQQGQQIQQIGQVQQQGQEMQQDIQGEEGWRWGARTQPGERTHRTGSRLPGLTRQGGKHTLQRPKTQPGAKTRKAASVAWHLHAAAGENLPATAAAQRRSVRPVQPLPRRTIFFIQNSLESAQWRQPRHKRKLSRNNIANCKTTQPLRRWQQPVGESCAYASAYVCPRKQARMRA